MIRSEVKHYKKKGKWHTLHIIEKTLIHHVIEWVATALSALGIILNSNIFGITIFNTYVLSFYVWVIANIFWIFFAWKHKHWGVFATFTIYAIINTLAILKNLGILVLY